jgi:uncharacterized repeat protein (TIGR01451 family)
MTNNRLISRAAAAAITILSTLGSIGAAHAFAPTLYAVTGAGGGSQCGATLSSLYTIDATTGASATVGPVMIGGTQARHVTGLDFDPSTGTLYAVMGGQQTDCSDDGQSSLLTIDAATGEATVVGTQGSIYGNMPDITFDPFGTLYAWNEYDGDSLHIIDKVAATSTRVEYGPSTAETGLASDSKGHLYLKSGTQLYLLNQFNAEILDSQNIGPLLKNILDFGANDVMFSGNRTTDGFDLYTIDPTDGSATFIGSNTVKQISAIAFNLGTPLPPPISDLSLSKVVGIPNPPVGTDVVFTLTVTNDGPDTASNVVVSDPLPSGYDYVTSNGDAGTYDDTTGEWTIPTILSGTFVTMDITATVLNVPGQHTNVAEVTASDSYDSDSIPGSGDESGDTYASVTPTVLYPRLFSIDRDSNQLWIVDPTFSTIDMSHELTIAGDDIFGANGLATQPETNTLFAVLQLSSARTLATIDPVTGEATAIGGFGDERVAAIAFGDVQSTLYAATGNSGSTPRTLFLVDPVDASMTALCTLQPDGYGRAIAYSDGLIYTATEICPSDCHIEIQVIDTSSFPGSSSDPCGGTLIETTLFNREPTSMTVESDANGTVSLLLGSFNEMYRITIPGVSEDADDTFVGYMSNYSKGLAFAFTDAKLANLQASKFSSKTRVKGVKLITYTIGASNQGPDTIDNLLLRDNLPTGTTLNTVDSNCNVIGGTQLECSVNQLEAGATYNFQFTLQVTCKKCSSITNNVALTADDEFYDYPYDNAASNTTDVKGKF